MRLRLPRSLFALSAIGSLALLPLVESPAKADASNVEVVGQWPLPNDVKALPMVAFDSTAHVSYVLSATATSQRAQAVDPMTGHAISPRAAVPSVALGSPVLVDSRHHLLLYVTPPVSLTDAPAIVGIGLRQGQLRTLFRVSSRFQNGVVKAMTLDAQGEDVIVLATGAAGTIAPTIDRLPLAGLLQGKLTPRWASPYQLPATVCPDVLSTNMSAGLSMIGSVVHFACRPTQIGLSIARPSFARQAGVVGLSGVTREAKPNISATLFQAAGDFNSDQLGESFLEPSTRRLILHGVYLGFHVARVFDTDHDRYVGTVQTGLGNLNGITSDPTSGRVYVTEGPLHGAVREFDLAPLRPSQGANSDFGLLLAQGSARHLAYDEVNRRLFVPTLSNGRYSFTLLRDNVERYAPQPALDYDAGALDAVDRPGATDSSRTANASGFGAQYALVGGLGALERNVTGIDDSTALLRGTRFLREGTVTSATLSGDASTAAAALGSEDTGTDADRRFITATEPTPGVVDAGEHFAPTAVCSDFGAAGVPKPVVADTATVSCNLTQARTAASAVFSSPRSLLVTVPDNPVDLPAPLEIGRASADVVVQRLPGRGALVSTVHARATNIDILGVATIGSVTSTLTVSAHGRHGTALAAPPIVSVTGVSVGGTPVCSTSCSLDQVKAVLNTALGVKGRVDFPTASVVRTAGGTFASVGQDPWMHAERVLDFDQDAEDYTVPAMTITLYLEGGVTSRLVVDLAATSASAVYRVFPLLPASAWTSPDAPVTTELPTVLPLAPIPGMKHTTYTGQPTVTPPELARGPLQALIDAVGFGFRSPSAALPLALVWALFALGPYLSARRRLLLELPLLTREQEIS